MTLYLEDLENLQCNHPNCDHTSHDAEMYFHGRCHPDSPTWTLFNRVSGEIFVVCAECEREVACIAVARKKAMSKLHRLIQKAKTSTRQEILIGKKWLDVGMLPLSYEVYWGADTNLLLQDEQIIIEDTSAGVVITRIFPKGTPIYPGEFKYDKFTTHDTVDIRRFSQREEVDYQGPPPPPNVIKAARAARATHISPDGKFIYTTKRLDVHWADGTSSARWHDKEEKFGYWGRFPGDIPADAVEISPSKKAPKNKK